MDNNVEYMVYYILEIREWHLMRKVILFIMVLLLSIGTCSQTAGKRTNEIPYEVKREVLFDDDGPLDEYITSEWNPSYTHVQNEKRYAASGGMIEYIEYSYNGDSGNITAKITRDVESKLRNRVNYNYNAQGKLWLENLLDNKNRIISSYEYAYNDAGYCVSRVIKDKADKKLAETVYTVDADGRKLVSETRDPDENTISSTRFTYDPQGNLIKEEVINGEGKLTSVITYEWQDGYEIKNELKSADEKVQMRITSEYGNRGQLTKKTINNLQGESKQVVRYEYIFRRQG